MVYPEINLTFHWTSLFIWCHKLEYCFIKTANYFQVSESILWLFSLITQFPFPQEMPSSVFCVLADSRTPVFRADTEERLVDFHMPPSVIKGGQDSCPWMQCGWALCRQILLDLGCSVRKGGACWVAEWLLLWQWLMLTQGCQNPANRLLRSSTSSGCGHLYSCDCGIIVGIISGVERPQAWRRLPEWLRPTHKSLLSSSVIFTLPRNSCLETKFAKTFFTS